MITYHTGNLFDTDCEALINTVNVVGVMGKGIALQAKQRWPKMYEVYRERCKKNLLQPGRVSLVNLHPTGEVAPKWVINFPTKGDWRKPSELEWILTGTHELCILLANTNIKSVAIPMLGCGLGGLQWTQVHDIMVSELQWIEKDFDIQIHGVNPNAKAEQP